MKEYPADLSVAVQIVQLEFDEVLDELEWNVAASQKGAMVDLADVVLAAQPKKWQGSRSDSSLAALILWARGLGALPRRNRSRHDALRLAHGLHSRRRAHRRRARNEARRTSQNSWLGCGHTQLLPASEPAPSISTTFGGGCFAWN